MPEISRFLGIVIAILYRDLDGPVFEPLREPTVFQRVHLHPELHTVVWPNGADFAPEFLHERVRVSA
jgi:hypothetical protein